MKKIQIAVQCFALLLATGCSNLKLLTPAVVKQGVTTGVALAATQYPNTVPELHLAADVICQTANSADLSPTNVISKINQITDLSPASVFAINAALTLYIGVWDSYGAAAVNNQPVLRTYLQATCDGFNAGLGTFPGASPAIARPMVNFK